MDNDEWLRVDGYFAEHLTREDESLHTLRGRSSEAGLPEIEISVAQAGFLSLLCGLVGARRVLEFGTLGGYSATWFARAVGDRGVVTSFELDPHHAEVARGNLDLVGVGDRVDVVEGPAAESAQRLVEAAVEPFDLVFIDADKPGNPAYLDLSMQLTRSGSVIVVDNVVRGGEVANAQSDNASARGAREAIEKIGADSRLESVGLQTVGAKGWDGFAIARVR